MQENAKKMVLASFVGDSLALGAHWIYDTHQIAKTFGRVDALMKPSASSYHGTKDKGDFTHYGDQTLVLLDSVAEKKGFALQDFSLKWRTLFENYGGYVDQATRGTLANYAAGQNVEKAGSLSNDLAGAARVAPLVYCYINDLDALTESARAQTKMTHTDPATVDSSEFFARVAHLTLHGASPVDAVQQVTREHFRQSPLTDWVESGLGSRASESVATIVRFGQSCHTPDAFPGVIHLIAKYENDLKEAMVQAVMAGGDSAARGMIVGMTLGAYSDSGSLPEDWVSELKAKDRILSLLEKIKD